MAIKIDGSSGTDIISAADGSLTIEGVVSTDKLVAKTEDWITHTGDTNTRMGFPAADIFAVETAGSERVRINSAGEVFIGGTTQGRETQFSVDGAYQDIAGVWTQSAIYSTDSQAADKGGTLGFGGQDGSVAKQQFAGIKGAKENGTSGNYAGYMSFWTRPAGGGTAERLRIDSSGRLLVGTATAAGNGIHVLYSTVNSAVEFQNNTTGTGSGQGLYVGNSTSNIGYLWNYANDALVFATNNTERLRIDSNGLITQGGKTASNHGSPNLLIWGSDPTLHLTSSGSTNNSSFTGIKFAVAGGSTGDYAKAGIFVQRQSTYTDLDMIFAFRSTADAAGVVISDEKIRFTSNGNIKASNFLGRNKIINGAMRFNQRGGTHSYAHDGTTNGNNLDRFQVQMGGASTYDCVVSRETTAPAGFSNSLKLTTGTAEAAIAQWEYLAIYQKIEGHNLQDFAYGTSSAKTVTMSFWVRSSITGTYTYTAYRDEGTDRVINKTYTINSANTWEKKSITFDGDTSAAISNNNSARWWNVWMLASGSGHTATNSTTWANYTSANWAGGHTANGMMTTAGASFYLTGIQLEIGDTATEFEYKLYDEELASCQRYYEENMVVAQSYVNGANHVGISASYMVTKRAPASLSWTLDSSGNMSGTSPNAIHRNRVDGAYAYQSAAGAGNFYYYYIYKADAEL